MAFGFIEGAAETMASFSRLFSGWLSDFLNRRKPLTAAGYTLANVVKPLLAVTIHGGRCSGFDSPTAPPKGFAPLPAMR